MRYAHLADLHLGSWREQKMRDLSTQAFIQAIDNCVARDVDFILFAGDLFNTSLPSLDTLKIVTKKLKELKDKDVPLYVIAGSHDFSPSGKTMIDVLENAGLMINVCKGSVDPETKELVLNFTVDQKTGTKITGMLGRKGQLEGKYYENLRRENLEQDQSYKIFMFHTTVSELLPKDLAMIDSQPLSLFPKNFNYYAGGHIHHPTLKEFPDYPAVTYTGSLFPVNFPEMEKYSRGSYYIVDVDGNKQQKIELVHLEMIQHQKLILDCNQKSPEEITNQIINHFEKEMINEKILTMRLFGTLKEGKISEINFKQIFELLYAKNAYYIMKNTNKLNTKEFSEIKISNTNPENIEEEIIKEHLQQIKLYDYSTELNLTKSLLNTLNTAKKEGENNHDFQRRVNSEMKKLLQLES